MKNLFQLMIIGFSLSAHAVPTDFRLEQIKTTVFSLKREEMFRNIQISYELTAPIPAQASAIAPGKYLIEINQSIFSTLTASAQNFIGLHELGHIYLGHSDTPAEMKNRFEVELEADAFAAYAYLRFFGQVDEQLGAFIEIINGKQATVPPGPVRSELIHKIFSEMRSPY